MQTPEGLVWELLQWNMVRGTWSGTPTHHKGSPCSSKWHWHLVTAGPGQNRVALPFGWDLSDLGASLSTSISRGLSLLLLVAEKPWMRGVIVITPVPNQCAAIKLQYPPPAASSHNFAAYTPHGSHFHPLCADTCMQVHLACPPPAVYPYTNNIAPPLPATCPCQCPTPTATQELCYAAASTRTCMDNSSLPPLVSHPSQLT